MQMAKFIKECRSGWPGQAGRGLNWGWGGEGPSGPALISPFHSRAEM